MRKVRIADWNDLEPLQPAYALVASVDLVVIRWEDEEQASVRFGRCLHRGALFSDFFGASTDLMRVMARASGLSHLSHFSIDDLTTWKREMANLTGIPYGGISLD